MDKNKIEFLDNQQLDVSLCDWVLLRPMGVSGLFSF
jgi:hypothetical protein